MDFRPIVAPSIRELFIQQLEGAILSGQLKPGDRLPTERELADTMHISKTVVHEGLRELHRLGFLDIASRRGVTVADYAQTGSLETLTAIMDYHGGLPDEKTARSILRLRYYLEAPALRDLAASHTPGTWRHCGSCCARPRQLRRRSCRRPCSGITGVWCSWAATPSRPCCSTPLRRLIWSSGPATSAPWAGRRVCALWPGLRTSSPPDRGTRPPGCWARAWSNSRLLCRSSTFSLRSPHI